MLTRWHQPVSPSSPPNQKSRQASPPPSPGHFIQHPAHLTKEPVTLSIFWSIHPTFCTLSHFVQHPVDIAGIPDISVMFSPFSPASG